jgi:hypothetical protein
MKYRKIKGDAKKRKQVMTSDGSRKRKKEKNEAKGAKAYGVGCPKG